MRHGQLGQPRVEPGRILGSGHQVLHAVRSAVCVPGLNVSGEEGMVVGIVGAGRQRDLEMDCGSMTRWGWAVPVTSKAGCSRTCPMVPDECMSEGGPTWLCAWVP